MPAPTPLTIATQSVQRLVKEEKYYRKELTQQSERVKKLETDLKESGESADSNASFVLKQEVRIPLFLLLSSLPFLSTLRARRRRVQLMIREDV